MIQYSFVEGWQASCFGAIATPSARFITHHLESVEMPITQPPLADLDLQRLSNVRQDFINVRPIPQRSTVATNQATLQQILTLLQRERRELKKEPTRRFRIPRTHMASSHLTRRKTKANPIVRRENTNPVVSEVTTFKSRGV